MRAISRSRRLLLIGRLDEAERTLAGLDPAPLAAGVRGPRHELVVAGIAMRRLQTKAGARGAGPGRARGARQPASRRSRPRSRAPPACLDAPAARLIARGAERPLLLDEVEALLASRALVVDACRHVVRDAGTVVSLATRPVLFALARALAEAWPDDVGAEHAARARLRRPSTPTNRTARGSGSRSAGCAPQLRAARRRRRATGAASRSRPPRARGRRAGAAGRRGRMPRCSRFLADGESWSSSALALALGASQRTVQRALDALAAAGKVQSFGRGRARRWMTPPVPGFPTTLLLPGPLPGG